VIETTWLRLKLFGFGLLHLLNIRMDASEVPEPLC
jgi:hypothetical protein